MSARKNAGVLMMQQAESGLTKDNLARFQETISNSSGPKARGLFKVEGPVSSLGLCGVGGEGEGGGGGDVHGGQMQGIQMDYSEN